MVDCFCCPVVLLCRHQRRQRVLPPQPLLWLLHAVLLCAGSFVLCAGPDLLRSGPGPDLLCSGSLRCPVVLRSGPLRRAVVLRSGPELWLWLQ
jgi:hypothetical protein